MASTVHRELVFISQRLPASSLSLSPSPTQPVLTHCPPTLSSHSRLTLTTLSSLCHHVPRHSPHAHHRQAKVLQGRRRASRHPHPILLQGRSQSQSQGVCVSPLHPSHSSDPISIQQLRLDTIRDVDYANDVAMSDDPILLPWPIMASSASTPSPISGEHNHSRRQRSARAYFISPQHSPIPPSNSTQTSIPWTSTPAGITDIPLPLPPPPPSASSNPLPPHSNTGATAPRSPDSEWLLTPA